MVKKKSKQSLEPLDPHTNAEDQGLLEKLEELSEGQKSTTEDKEFHSVEAVSTAQLPSMPSSEESPSDEELNKLRQNHLSFYWTGKLADNASAPELPDSLIPALVSDFKDLTRLRYNYPVFVPFSSNQEWCYPFSDLINELIDQIQVGGDEGELIKRYLLKIEKEIKGILQKKGMMRLLEVWDEAADRVKKEFKLKNNKLEFFDSELGNLKQQIPGDGYLVPDDKDASLWLFQYAAKTYWREKTAVFAEELQHLIHRLEEILQLDEEFSNQQQDAEHLQSSMGKIAEEEVDFEVLSSIITSTNSQPVLTPQRRQRIRTVLETLKAMSWLYIADQENTEDPTSTLFLFSDKYTKSVQTAWEIFQEQLNKVTAFFKSIHIARLEVNNRYKEELHNDFFENFTIDYLTESEKELFPPFILPLHTSQLKPQDKSTLVELLSMDYPIKIFLQVDDLYHQQLPTQVLHPQECSCWASALGRMALQLNTAYVMQSGYSNITALTQSFPESIRYDGPALLMVYGGIPESHSTLPPFVTAAAAEEARIFPAFCYNPANGDDWASRFTLEFTTAFEQRWPENPFYFTDINDEQGELSLSFTPMEFWMCDKRFRQYFLPVPVTQWHSHMMEAEQFLDDIGEKLTTENIPYLLAVDDEKTIWRVLPNHSIIHGAQKIARIWKSIQELGGVNNSHALRLLEAERQKLKEEIEAELAELKAQHQTEMEKTVEEMAEDVISSIAAALLGGSMPAPLTGAPSRPTAPTTPREAPPTPQVSEESVTEEAEAPAVEEEEEELSFSEPYIDTPLCTSCNECINQNNMMFAYNENKQAYIKDPSAGTFRELVQAAEKCPVHIIHPGKPLNPDEPGLDELIKRAEKYN